VDAIGEKTNRRLIAYIVKQQHRADIKESEQRWKFKAQENHLRKSNPEQFSIDLISPDKETLQKQRIQRRTFRSFLKQTISLESFGRFLSSLMPIEIEGMSKYRYGSAGGLYPVQTYFYIKPSRIEGILGGIYYYHPKEHRLILIHENPKIYAYIHYPGNQEMFLESAFSIFFIGYQKAIEPMYGERSLHYSILEAGIMSQLLEEAAIE
jgi:SagB-type dehydrogenase family enzyme